MPVSAKLKLVHGSLNSRIFQGHSRISDIPGYRWAVTSGCTLLLTSAPGIDKKGPWEIDIVERPKLEA